MTVSTADDVGPRLLGALAAEVGQIVAETTGPLLERARVAETRATTAEAQVRDLGAALAGANGEVGRLEREVTAALEASATKDTRISELLARIAELEAGQPQPKRTRLSLAVGVQPPHTTKDATYVWLRDELRKLGIDPGYHSFSELNLPTRYGVLGDNAMLPRYQPSWSMTNVKTPDIPAGAEGKSDAAWRSLLTSCHEARPGTYQMFVDWHEPENDGLDPLTWRRLQVRRAEVFYDHPISAHGDYGPVLMGFTAEPGTRWNLADWDLWRDAPGTPGALPAHLRSKVVQGWDIYFKAERSVEENWAGRAKPAFEHSARREQRVAIWETASNNNAGVPSAQYAAGVGGLAQLYDESVAESVCWYVHPGPAAGTRPWLDLAALEALAAALR